jgi:hypothetical protein
MKRVWICSLLPILSLLGCGDATVTSAVSPEVEATTNGISTLSCLVPGPAPLLPTILQQGILTDGRGTLVSRFKLESGPFIRTEEPILYNCPQWQIGTQLTVTTFGQERVFWSEGTYGSLEGRVVFSQDATPTCPQAAGIFILQAAGDEQGRWALLERSCAAGSEPLRLFGRYFLTPAAPDPGEANSQ